MEFKGIDTAASVTADAAETLKAEGYTFVGRYVVPESGTLKQKALTAAEARTVLDAGLAILCIYETTAERAKKGASAGTQDGAAARIRAKELGVGQNAVIYFAVDYDAPAADYGAITAYFAAAKNAVLPYQIGVYGSKSVCEAINGLAGYYQCYAWSSGIASNANIYQSEWQQGKTAVELHKKLGFAVDIDMAKGLETMWKPTAQLAEKASVQWMKRRGYDERYFSKEQWEKLCDIIYGFHGPSDPQWFSGTIED